MFLHANRTSWSRERLWADRDSLFGCILRVKYVPVGSKDAPRHPVFSGWRDALDMDTDPVILQ